MPMWHGTWLAACAALAQCDNCSTVRLTPSRLLQNLDGTLGRLLPASLKDKVHRAMDEGIDHTFGKVEENRVRHTPCYTIAAAGCVARVTVAASHVFPAMTEAVFTASAARCLACILV